jgi:hypothetical protein
MRKTRRIPILKEEDTDPLSVVVNLFDVAMVFAVSLMVAMVMNMNMSEFFSDENFSIVKQKGEEVEIIKKEGKKITKYKTIQNSTTNSSTIKKGKRLGSIYEDENGESYLISD